MCNYIIKFSAQVKESDSQPIDSKQLMQMGLKKNKNLLRSAFIPTAVITINSGGTRTGKPGLSL